jgi:hypothetical protein
MTNVNINSFISPLIFYLPHVYLSGMNRNLTVTDAENGSSRQTVPSVWVHSIGKLLYMFKTAVCVGKLFDAEAV